MTDLVVTHDELRPLMFSIAYRMLGSVAEAEDVVQEAFLRIHKSTLQGTVFDSPEAYATTVTTRLPIDALRSARHRREHYNGSWLPEPLIESEDADPAWRIEMDETVSIAFLMVLERLTPVERAVFLLREVFGYGYADIAAAVTKTEANCRQLLARARRSIDEARPRFDPSPERREELSRQFFAALEEGNLAGLESLLAADVTFYGDGGGKAPSVRKPMHGAMAVARFLLGLYRRGVRFGMQVELVHANGQPAVRILGPDGALLGVLSLDVADGRVQALQNQVNPEKLGHLGAVGDLAALLRSLDDA